MLEHTPQGPLSGSLISQESVERSPGEGSQTSATGRERDRLVRRSRLDHQGNVRPRAGPHTGPDADGNVEHLAIVGAQGQRRTPA